MGTETSPGTTKSGRDDGKSGEIAATKNPSGNPTSNSSREVPPKTSTLITSAANKTSATATKSRPAPTPIRPPTKPSTGTVSAGAWMPKQSSLSSQNSALSKSKLATTASATANSNALHGKNTGNDRVTVDKIRTPLAPASARSKPVDATAAATTTRIPNTKPNTAASTQASLARTSVPPFTNNKLGTVTPAMIQSANHSKPGQRVPPKGPVGLAAKPIVGASARPPHLSSLPAGAGTGTATNKLTTASTSSAAMLSGATLGAKKPSAAGVPTSSVQVQPVIDEQAMLEEKIKKERAPLTDKYGSFIIASDTNLEDARSRLRTAIEQTRQLRTAFTERVYGKYRVCLQPPATTEEILTRILMDPATASKELNTEITSLRKEKEIEKKEAQKLQAEMHMATMAAKKTAAGPGSSGTADGATNTTSGTTSISAAAATTTATPVNPLAAVNAENAEQLMYISAGLSLIVLPEQDTTGIDMSPYADRAPINPATGQRVKSISAAAAAAGEVMLDRARKGVAMRAERQRRFRLASSRKDSSDADQNYSRLSFLTNTNLSAPVIIPPSKGLASNTTPGASSNTKDTPSSSLSSTNKTIAAKSASGSAGPSKRPVSQPSATSASGSSTLPTATAKAIRARVQATMSVQTLLSLSPSTEELRPDGKLSAATLALMERGVGTHGQNTKAHNQQRFRHPFPESLGARRRTLQNSNTIAAKNDPLLHPGYAHLMLPPTPTTKERRTRKRLPKVVDDIHRAGSERARNAICNVLRQFGEPRDQHGQDGRRTKKPRLSEISFMHGLRSTSAPSINQKRPDSQGATSLDVGRGSNENMAMLALHVMQAVGYIKPSASYLDGSNKESGPTFPDNLDTSMFDVAEKRAFGDEGGTTRRSIQTLKDLNRGFKESKPHSFMDHFLEKVPTEERKESSGNSMEEAKAKVPAVAIRGGGEVGHDEGVGRKINGSDTKSASSVSDGDSTQTPKTANNKGAKTTNARKKAVSQPDPPSSPHTAWGNSSRQSLVLLQGGQQTPTSSQKGAGSFPANGRMTGHVAGPEHYHPNAIQLANQLRLSRFPPQGPRGSGDLAEYIGSLHPQSPPNGDWSPIGAASAAAVASAQSMAALGISPHRATLVNFPLQDRARAIIRDQQTAAAAAHAAAAHRQQQQALAYLSGGHGYPSAAAPPFPHMNGAMLNPSSFLGQQSIPPISHKTKLPAPRNGTATKPRSERPSVKENSDGSNAAVHRTTGETGHASATKTSESQPLDSRDGENATKKRKATNSPSTPSKAAKQTRVDNGSETESAKKTPSKEAVAKQRPQEVPKSEKEAAASATAKPTKDSGTASGLQFFVPSAPQDLQSSMATSVLAARSYEAIEKIKGSQLSEVNALVSYICSVGIAVPIPKALVAAPFKEKLSLASSRTAGLNSISQSSRDIAVASILLWLWRSHEQYFQDAFGRSGRIDVDPDCKWLISAAVDKSIQALVRALDEAGARPGSPFAVALSAAKSKSSTTKESDKTLSNSKLDLHVASITSQALMSGIKMDQNMDSALLHFNGLMDYLDESRKNALHSKSQERALLAALISRKATMSLPFSHAYVSSVVRAGEALGHGELFEVVQNEDVNVSTMIPYDVFTDESGAWEDPCRPANGFNSNLTGDDLMRRAHARAMMQKSLKKLQERHNVKGGTSTSGAYTDPPSSSSGANADSKSTSASSGATTPRGWLKRRSSFSEPQVQPGTGSADATSWSLYEPKHISAPLDWQSDHVENGPYGRHDTGTRPRSLSLSQFNLKAPGKGRGRQSSRSMSFASVEQFREPEPDKGPMKRSTREIPWVHVAGIFQNVALPGTPKNQEVSKNVFGTTIYAPVVRQVEFEDLDDSSGDESDREEDLRDETILANHQVVLDRMKEHLSAFLEARKKSQEKRKSRTNKT